MLKTKIPNTIQEKLLMRISRCNSHLTCYSTHEIWPTAELLVDCESFGIKGRKCDNIVKIRQWRVESIVNKK